MDKMTALLTAARFWGVQFGLLPGIEVVPFVILAGPRSGSTLLQTTIDQHPNLVCMHELARMDVKPPNFSRYFLGKQKNLCALRNSNAREFLKDIYNAKQPQMIKALGFKALFTQPAKKTGNWDIFWTALSEVADLRVIHLTRNRVESVASLSVALKTNRWRGVVYEENPITVDADWFIEHMRKEASLEQAACRLLSESKLYEVDYAELVTERQRICDGVFDFLGLCPSPVFFLLRKQRATGFETLIGNWDEIKARIADSEFNMELVALQEQ